MKISDERARERRERANYLAGHVDPPEPDPRNPDDGYVDDGFMVLHPKTVLTLLDDREELLRRTRWLEERTSAVSIEAAKRHAEHIEKLERVVKAAREVMPHLGRVGSGIIPSMNLSDALRALDEEEA